MVDGGRARCYQRIQTRSEAIDYIIRLDYVTFPRTIGHPGPLLPPYEDISRRLQILFELEMASLPLGSDRRQRV